MTDTHADAAQAAAQHATEILILMAAAQFMVILDVSVVIVALPSMRADLGFSATELQWVVNAYTLTFGGFLLLGGRAADLFGRRRIFLLGVFLFSFASLIGGLAQTPGMLVGARALQGLGGAVVAPATLSILTATFKEGPERNRAFAVWGGLGILGGSTGGLVGGLLTQELSWRWILFINVPIGAALVWRAARDLPNDTGDHRQALRTLDVPGAIMVTVALSAIVFGIVHTDTVGWGSDQTIVALSVGGALVALFLWWETRVPAPLMPLGVFRSRQLSAANIVMFLFAAAMFSMWYFLSLYLQEVKGYGPLKTGVCFLPLSGFIAIATLRAAKLTQRFGIRHTLLAALVLDAAGLAWLSRIASDSSYAGHVLGPSLLLGLGMGLGFVPLTSAAMAGVARHEAGLASGIVNVSRQIGGALGLAILATIATARTKSLLAGGQVSPHAALADGFGRALLVAAAFALVGAAAVLAFVREAPVRVEEPVSAAAEALADRTGG